MLEKCIKYINKSDINELKKLLGFEELDDGCSMINSNLENINQISKKGFIPIHLACKIQDFNILQTLLRCKDVDINIRDPINSFTPVITLINYGGNIECLNLILKRNPNLSLCDEVFGDSPLHWAVKLELPSVVHRLIKSGMDVNLINKKTGYTPLHLGIINGSEEVVNELISLSADPRIKVNDFDGNSSLHLCILKNMPNLALNIFQSSTEKQKEELRNSLDKNGNTALHLALIYGMFGLTDFLIKEGFSKEIKNFQGSSCEDLIKEYQKKDSVDHNIYKKSIKNPEIRERKSQVEPDNSIYETQVSGFFFKYGIAERSYFDEINKTKTFGKHEFIFKLFYKNGFHNLDSKFTNLTISDLTSIGIKNKNLKIKILDSINQNLKEKEQELSDLSKEEIAYRKKKIFAYSLMAISTFIFIFFVIYIILNAVISSNSSENKFDVQKSKNHQSSYKKYKARYDI